MIETWEEICHLMNEHVRKNITEAQFQVEIVKILEKIGWKREHNEIVEQRNINIGSVPQKRSLRPDIIINIDRKDHFVIELKKTDATIIERNYEQLFSCMRQLKLRIGILITDKIHVFYEEENFNVPVEVLKVELKNDNPEGIKFLEIWENDFKTRKK